VTVWLCGCVPSGAWHDWGWCCH